MSRQNPDPALGGRPGGALFPRAQRSGRRGGTAIGRSWRASPMLTCNILWRPPSGRQRPPGGLRVCRPACLDPLWPKGFS